MNEVVGVPLYQQIATRIRHGIASGALQEGDPLPSLRKGADEWGVNLHTVRRAYQQLVEEGLAQTHPQCGTRVAATPLPSLNDHRESLDSFAAWVARLAFQRFGLTATELGERLSVLQERSAGPVWVLECSESLASSLAARIAGTWSVDARPWPVEKAEETPEGSVLGTFYHYAELRRAFRRSRRQPSFFGVSLEEENLRSIADQAREAGRLVLLSADARSGGALAGDLARAIGTSIELDVRVTPDPRAALATLDGGVPVLLSPENWDRLDAAERSSPHRFELRLEPDQQDLSRIALAHGWTGRLRTSVLRARRKPVRLGGGR